MPNQYSVSPNYKWSYQREGISYHNTYEDHMNYFYEWLKYNQDMLNQIKRDHHRLYEDLIKCVKKKTGININDKEKTTSKR